MTVVQFPDGIAINGEFPNDYLDLALGLSFPLTFTDPPYGKIVDEAWDDYPADVLAEALVAWAQGISNLTIPGGAIYMFGGIGTPGNRPFFKFLSQVEDATDLKLANLITWKKKRAYGVQWNYLFVREELAYFVKGDPKKPHLFNVPLLSEKRPYPGYSKKYPAKSEFYRRTNVWTDITEILRGKKQTAEKPVALAKVAIETHTVPGDYVFDPFACSGSTAHAARELGRKFVLVEKDPQIFDEMVERLR